MAAYQFQFMSHPFNQKELVLLEIANSTAALQGHHHHHHHHHHEIEYHRPAQLTTSIGLFALKKLNAMDPTFLKVRQARYLQPVNPGILTELVRSGLLFTGGMYGLYLWRGRGFRGFFGPAVIPLVALYGVSKITLHGVNWARENLYSKQRSQMVNRYVSKYGEQFLLNVLDPTFRLESIPQ